MFLRVTGFVSVFVIASTVYSGQAGQAWAGDGLSDTGAATSETTITPPKEPPTGESVDDLLTNNNLRAYSGSASLWSIASTFNYNGGTISSPLSQDRPNVAQASGVTTKSDLDGAVSVKYNLNTRSSLQAGVGMRWIAPLTPKGPSNYDGTTFDVMNPYLTYQYIYKWFGIQSVLQVSGMQWTQADQTAIGSAQQFNADQENMYEIGASHVSVGASVQLQWQRFNKSGAYGTPGADNYIANLGDVQSQYLFSFAPELEYQLTEKINLRTFVNLWYYEHYVSDPRFFGFVHDAVFQSFGVGVAVTRDIFLYPNIQFLPAQMQAALTNVGLTATVNLF